ncbi:hypothetical protein PAXINDRAFT_157371 [Paxillus involutus ATCC 200175]|uniref:WD40 repeat-like protein n=1 Tax=Paxillus involutus ATCC 200175 TaxID=664439 RepID=A0A0C9TV76_PAXIN|nr:hypothetical protein PAXINDRAFT_157371 [Paxillus involutus ATCC 200175]
MSRKEDLSREMSFVPFATCQFSNCAVTDHDLLRGQGLELVPSKPFSAPQKGHCQAHKIWSSATTTSTTSGTNSDINLNCNCYIFGSGQVRTHPLNNRSVKTFVLFFSHAPSGFVSVLTSPPGTGTQETRHLFTDYSVPGPVSVPRQNQQSSGFSSYDRLDSKRRQRLLNLLNVLNELTQSESLDQGECQRRLMLGTHFVYSTLLVDLNLIPSLEDDRDDPTMDEQLQVAGAEAFNKFHKRINNLDKELRNFANAARQLGSSVGILSTAFRLRERLAHVLFLFRENGADLFPRKVARQPRETLVNPNVMEKRRRKNKVGEGVWSGFGEGSNPNPNPTLGSSSVSNNQNADDFLDTSFFPEHLEAFAADVVAFLNCLNEFPEFSDEAMNASIRAFEGDLKYWACCLNTYKTQFKYPAVQRYIHDLTSEMGDHVDSITSTLITFIEVVRLMSRIVWRGGLPVEGVPTIRFAQKHGASNLLTLSTVATFFSAVTATTLQFSYSSTSTVLEKSVNAFWFSSLVFSIAAAVNSLLGLSWKMAMYRSPGHRVPWWVLIWIKRSPLVFLVMSVACFSAGLVLFTYATGQGKVTSTITSVFTAFTSFGLAAVSLWFASERWTFVRFRGQKWLQDVLMEWWGKVVEFVEAVMGVPPFSWIAWLSGLIWRVMMWVWTKVEAASGWTWSGMERAVTSAGNKARVSAIRAGVKLGLRPVTDLESELTSRSIASPPSLSTSSRTAATGAENDDSTALPTSLSQPSLAPPSPRSPFGQTRSDFSSPLRPRPSSWRLDPRRPIDAYDVSSPIASSQGHIAPGIGGVGTTAPDSNSSGQPISPISPRDRFTHAIRSVIMLQSASSGVSAFAPVRKRTTSSAVTSSGSSSATLGGNFRGYGQGGSGGASGLQGSRLVSLVTKLRSLSTAQDILAHSALVRHLKFSPDGKFLATSSWDRTTIIFKVAVGNPEHVYVSGHVSDHCQHTVFQQPLVQHRILAHPSGFVGQVAWSPLGNLLLTKLNRVIKMWTQDGVCRKTIDRQCAVQAVAWMPGGEAFLSVEGSEVVKLWLYLTIFWAKDLNGNILERYAFHRVLIHDVAATPDSLRLLVVGPVMSSPTGLLPSKSRVEKQLLVYNVETKMIENQTPVLNDVRDITLARNGQVALISYEYKAPPQLWKLDVVKDRIDSTTTTARLSLRHTYMPTMPIDFAGHSYFGGKDDQLVLCAGKAGDIHIWDRDSAVLLHHVRAQDLGGDLTCIACNQSAEDPFMFATGSHDGAVRIWTTSDAPNRPQEQPGPTSSSLYSVTPHSPYPLHFGLRTDSPVRQLQALANDFAVGSMTPLTMSSGEEDTPRDRSVTFISSKA